MVFFDCAAPEERCSDTENDGGGCLESDFRELPAIPRAIQNDTTEHKSDDDVQAVADVTDAKEANPSSGPDNIPNCRLQPGLCQCSDSPLLRHSVQQWIFSFERCL